MLSSLKFTGSSCGLENFVLSRLGCWSRKLEHQQGFYELYFLFSSFKRPRPPQNKHEKDRKRKYIKYSLEDVSDVTDRSNSMAAFSFLRELREKREKHENTEGDESPQDKKITFKKPSKRNTVEPSESGGKRVLPEAVVGQTSSNAVRKAEKKSKPKSKSDFTKQTVLSHLNFEAEEED